ncbi:hypothetical protein QOZ80_4BG0337860 [Eleusine coracana subsp. coracana]|nr:hypothetical protein QOZ80_4BG0337860 [Eleusine coracana subsp. coracana]
MEELNSDFDVPLAELNAIKFDLMSSEDMEKLSSVSIVELSDVTSPKLGLPNGSPQCDTCGSQNTRDCDGHFGVTKLAATVHNPYFIDEVVHFLNQICPGCFNLKENVNMKKSERAPDQASCKYCSKDGAKTYPSKLLTEYQISPRVKIILSPYQVFHILKQIDPVLIEQFVSRRELLFLSSLPVTPNRHRVVEMGYGLADGPRLTFDPRTKGYRRMVDVSKRIDDYRQHPQFSVLASSLVSSRLSECLKSSKLYSKKTDGETSTDTYGMKWLKDAVLSKRSDNAFRSIMVNLVPLLVLGLLVPFQKLHMELWSNQ